MTSYDLRETHVSESRTAANIVEELTPEDRSILTRQLNRQERYTWALYVAFIRDLAR